MGQETGIAWTDHTFNPWWGCTKVSQGCKHCYADTFQRRYGHDVFGFNPDGSRKALRTFGDKHWNEPPKWNRDAEHTGVRRRVFCASMADVFDNHPEASPHRERLWALIRATPHLDWQLLTKRPENIVGMLPDDWGDGYPNVWLGTSVENQQAADLRVLPLLRVPAKVHFLSCEPLLGPVDLTRWLWPISGWWRGPYSSYREAKAAGGECGRKPQALVSAHAVFVDWVIIGGESGVGARALEPEWVDGLLADCIDSGTRVFFKQTGTVLAKSMRLGHSKGENPAEWPEKWQRQEFPK